MHNLKENFRNFLELCTRVSFLLIILLGLYRLGPFFCSPKIFFCIDVQRNTFLGILLTTPASSFYGFLAFWVTAIGLTEFFLVFKKKIRPKLIINHEKILVLSADRFPFRKNIPFRVSNEGDLTMERDKVYCRIFINKEIDFVLTEGCNDSSGFFPQVSQYVEYKPDFIALGGLIPVRIMPHRLNKVFSADLTFPESGEYVIEYYFNTDAGFYPKNILPWKKMKLNKENEPIKNLGTLIIRVN
ncbi:MAG: hypothetical protein AAB802_03740 [Patescibacteria group bacterium]